MADVHFCPTDTAAANLRRENISGEILITGNTVLDNLVDIEPRYDNHVVVTLHRRENLNQIKDWFAEIENIANKYAGLRFILPVHPNPVIKAAAATLKKVEVVEAMPHEQFVELLATCKLCITDSGGLQEESAFLRKRALVCRRETERPEGLGNFSTLVKRPADLAASFGEVCYNHIPKGDCPYGDGFASQRIVQRLRCTR
jgi:UDP-N-acetylglucosamine 2-epimerase (non-hydrolysing)